MHCQNCKKVLPIAVSFCPYCGAKLTVISLKTFFIGLFFLVFVLLAFNYCSKSNQPKVNISSQPRVNSTYNHPTQRPEQEKLDTTVPPQSTILPPPHAEDSPPTEKPREIQDAETVVRNYYEDLNRGDANSAIAKWLKPDAERLRNLISNIEWFRTNTLESVYVNGDKAIVKADVEGKSRGRDSERWRGEIKLILTNDGWKILKLNLFLLPNTKATHSSTQVKKPMTIHEPETVVRSYYEDLNHGDANSAITKWLKPDAERLRNLIRNIEWFRTNKLESAYVSGDKAVVKADVEGKSRGKYPEHWTGEIELTLTNSGWKILKLNLEKR